MKVVVDASVLVGELLRQRGRALIARTELELFGSAQVLEETRYELGRRINRMSRLTEGQQQELLRECQQVVSACVMDCSLTVYQAWEEIARERVPRDPNDWSTVALALVLGAEIWTQDADFLGCGIPTWRTETLSAHMQRSG
jgi:predicted nucleic acid-binding protein